MMPVSRMTGGPMKDSDNMGRANENNHHRNNGSNGGHKRHGR